MLGGTPQDDESACLRDCRTDGVVGTLVENRLLR